MEKKSLLCWGIFLLFCACSPHSSEEFHQEGEALCRSLIEVLKTIDNTEQLVLAEPVLKKKFDNLVSLMIEASRFQQDHSDEWKEDLQSESSLVSLSLKEQLHRIYRMEKGREVIERSQQESLIRLDAYERLRLKEREKIKK